MALIERRGRFLIRAVSAGSPAAASGLRSGDEILSIDGEAAQDLEALRARLSQAPGTALSLRYRRAAEVRSATLVLAALL
jgi:S1-C subfamily serine protease